MKRRRLFLVLAILLPLSIFGAAKWAARYRPIGIGRVEGANAINGVSNRYLSVPWNITGSCSFDLNNGTQININAQSGVTRDWIWSIETRVRPRLVLTKNDLSFAYFVPRLDKRNDWAADGGLSVSALVVAPECNCVQLLLGSRYYRWNLRSRSLERDFQMPIIYGAFCAFSRDGKTLVEAGRYAVATFSTLTGRTLTYRPGNPKLKFGMSTCGISAYGSYIIADNLDGNFDVERTRDGRVLWQFDPTCVPTFSPDETLTALPLQEKGLWEVRETKTGHLIRTLISVPGRPSDYAGAFSPDNSTFYSVANGVLYRQRAN